MSDTELKFLKEELGKAYGNARKKAYETKEGGKTVFDLDAPQDELERLTSLVNGTSMPDNLKNLVKEAMKTSYSLGQLCEQANGMFIAKVQREDR